MSRLGVARFNTAVMFAVVGIVAGHWLQPVFGMVLWPRAAGFLLIMAALGALRGWREARLHQPPVAGRAAWLYGAAFALGAVVLVVVGYVAFHGPPA